MSLSRITSSPRRPDNAPHAAGTRRSHRLTIDVIGNVTGGEYTRHTGGGGIAGDAGLDLDVTVCHVQLTFEDSGVGGMADGDEYPLQREFAG